MKESALKKTVLGMVCVAVCAGGVGSRAWGQAKYFSADDLPKIVRMSDPQISPDGREIAFLVGRADMKEDRWVSEIDLVDVATKKVRVLTHDRMGVGMARWSPSGDRLAFLAQDANKKEQIFVLGMEGGDSMQVTKSKTSVSSLAWRPDGEALAYAAVDEEPEKKDEAKFEDAFEVGNNDVLEKSRMMPVHLWTVTLAGGEMKRVTSGAWSLPNHLPGGPPAIAWMPDGKSIVFTKTETPLTGDSGSVRMMVVTLADGAVKPLTGANVSEDGPVLSPDGTKVAYSSPRDGKRGWNLDLFVASTAGGATGTDVAYALDRPVGGAQWMPDNKTLLIATPDHTKVAMWVQPVGGKATRVEMGGLEPGAFNVGKDGSVAFTASTAAGPAELYYAAKVGDAPVQMTHLLTVTDGVKLGRQETVKWTNDGFAESGVLTYPPEYVAGKKYAMVLYIHGGPTGSSVETFTPSSQILAAQGWLVFEPNYRGSNSDGNAYQAAIIKDAGKGPGRDVMAGVKAVEAKGIVDEKRIAVSGWSYGGYMTSWLIGNYPEAWKAAVAGAPVTDLVDIYTLSDVTQLSLDTFGPSPFVGDGLKLYVAGSPMTYANKMKTPTLIMCDVGDYRVPISMAYKLYHALKDNGAPVKFIAYPVAGHSPADPIRARDVWRRWTAWLAPYLNEGAAVKTAE
jgi:dipeptidyl aminopeptidase/acylaminoacyl peptidase